MGRVGKTSGTFEREKYLSYALITDFNVQKLYGEKLVQELNTRDFRLNSYRSRRVKLKRSAKQMLDTPARRNYGRDTVILALGGGWWVIAGFVPPLFARRSLRTNSNHCALDGGRSIGGSGHRHSF